MHITPFVDREPELRRLMAYAERGFYPVLYIYGPEGCGKTRLLLELAKRLEGREDFVIVYVDAEACGDPREAVFSTPEVVNQIVQAVASETLGAVGRVVALLLPSILSRVLRRRVEGRKVVVLVDDVARPLGLDAIEAYAKRLLNLLEQLYAEGASTVFIAATTSESLSRRLLARHTYTTLTQIWNLPPKATRELLERLNAPKDVAQDAWRLLGGNPRLAIMLRHHGWDYNSLIEALKTSIHASLGHMLREQRDLLQEALRDPDILLEHPKLLETLMEANLVTPVDRPCLGYTPPADPEVGIGRFYAWVTPAHREALRRLLESV